MSPETIEKIRTCFKSNDINIDRLLHYVPNAFEYRFSIEGPKNSIITYRIWGDGIIDAWFGKSNSDSGGLGLQGSLNSEVAEKQLKGIIGLHKRFIKSGKRKVLRNYEEKRRGW